ncbi:MAG: hypothetical protein A3F31_02985 [Candidatus Levybacteria bacterium RIFCSPHIGHO2_12_FULL_38_12]|nr:MAG: hypothetical protein A2770_00545 [Candidatus Levybacteria bacterium RIFCSPHIGHO2_01_FULL_38_12]OGH22653.1 MAG: hypothetical protein A3F31_02985 [Candidatus Levybacteria bacterium RIFCSPHIGHO2_12_FULL_38_12]OGH44992.1 MAG: hypothetical protein A3J14_03905 [Candidatus Levybacteria bacterium RIFCSPLOWO2_02_FULL_37_18]
MENQDTPNISTANNVLVSGGLTLTVFWILNILKTAFPMVKSFLTFHKPVGPLSGLYIISILFFALLMFLFTSFKIRSQTKACWIYAVSIILFVIMVFPPVFEPIAHLLGGK